MQKAIDKMGTIFKKQKYSTKRNDIIWSDKQFAISFLKFLKTQLTQVRLDKSYLCPLFKTSKGDFFAMTKEDLEEMNISKYHVEDKILFYGKMTYMIPYKTGITLIEVYQNKNEFAIK